MEPQSIHETLLVTFQFQLHGPGAMSSARMARSRLVLGSKKENIFPPFMELISLRVPCL